MPAISLERSDEFCKYSRAAAPPPRSGTLAADGRAPRPRDRRRARGRLALACGRPRRRDDAAREAPLEGRPGGGRRARGEAARGRRARLRRRTARPRRPRWPRGSSGAEHRLAWNRAGANLLSGVASALARRPGRGARAVRGRRGRASRGDRAHAARSRRALEPLPGPARPLRRARARRRALARGGRRHFPPRRCSWSTPTTRSSPISRTVASGSPLRRSTTRGTRARRSSTPPTRSTACAAARRTTYEAAYVGHLGDYRCPSCGHARPRARRRRAGHRAARAARVALPPRHAATGSSTVELALPGPLQRLQRRRRRGARRSRSGAPARRRSAPAWRASAPPSGASSGSRRAAKRDRRCCSSRTRRARTRRCARSRPGVPPVLVLALNDAIADGRDVSWIWDVDFEPLLPHVERVVVTGERAAELGLRLVYGGLPEERLEVVPALEARARPRARARRGGHRARRPPDLHGDARAARRSSTERGLVRPYWEAGAREDPRRPPLPGVPQHLRRPGQHRRPRRAARRCAGTSSTVTPIGLGDRARPERARPALRRRRAGPRAGARRARSRREGRGDPRGGRRRRRAARGLRRLPAARSRLSRARRLVHAGRRALPARDGGRRDADDRRRPARVRARARASAPAARRASRTTRAAPCSTPEPSRSAASSTGSGTTARRASRAAGWDARSARTCTGRCCRGTRGSPTGCSRGRSRMPAGGEPPDARAAPGRARGGGVPGRGGAGARRAAASLKQRRFDGAPRPTTRCQAYREIRTGGTRIVERACRSTRDRLRAPTSRRGRPPGRRAASAAGSAGSADGARSSRAPRSRNARCPRTASSCEATSSSEPGHVRGEDHVDDVLSDGLVLGRDRVDDARPGPRAAPPRPSGRARSPPTSSRRSASTRLSPARTPPPGSSQTSLARLLVPESRMRPAPAQDRRDPDPRLDHAQLADEPKPRAPRSLVGQLVDLDQADGGDRRDDELRDAHPRLDRERLSRDPCSGARRGSRRGSPSRSGRAS